MLKRLMAATFFTSLACGHVLSAPSSIKHSPVNFSGYNWQIKSALTSPVPGGPNYYSDSLDNIWTDDSGRLHLRISKLGDKWVCAEASSVKPLGYGTYRFYLDSPADNFDPNVVLGLFIWGPDPAFAHRELDIEFSVWASRTRPNAQYVIQPAQSFLFNEPPGLQQTIHSFTWRPGMVSFQSTRLDGSIIMQHTFTQNVPTPLDETPRLILWLYKGQAPANNQPVEAIISHFEFAP